MAKLVVASDDGGVAVLVDPDDVDPDIELYDARCVRCGWKMSDSTARRWSRSYVIAEAEVHADKPHEE